MNKELKSLVRQQDGIKLSAEKLLLRQIQRYSKRYNRSVLHVYNTVQVKKGKDFAHGQEVDSNQIDKLVKYFEDHFGLLPFFVCVSGKFIEAQTPLIAIKKPRL